LISSKGVALRDSKK